MFRLFRKEKPNYGKIIAITLGVIAGIAAIAALVYFGIKLARKYFVCTDCDCDELDDCECDCELCEGNDAEEAFADVEVIDA